MRKKLYTVAAFLTISGAALAQYTVEWTSPNLGQYGWGGAYAYDIDNDGLVEFEVRTSNQFTFYNGNYTAAWTISFPGYDYVSVLHPRDINGDGILVPLNTDNDGAGEVVVAGYYFSSPTYYGRFRVYDASSHAMEFESSLITGFYGSGSVEDIDGDGRDEIIITRFGTTTSESYVSVYAYTLGTDESQPGYVLRTELSTAPNPNRGETVVSFNVPSAGAETSLKVVLFDIAGRLIKTLLEASCATPGEYRLLWDGTDDSGTEAPAGTYIVQITFGKRKSTTNVNLVR